MPSLDADYYALLGVDPRADSATIRNAWASEQRLWGVRQNAPDLATRHQAERHVQLLGEIKDVLLDTRRRAEYDREHLVGPIQVAAARARPVPVVPARDVHAPVHQAYASRHNEIVKAVGVGLAGGLISGSQILHWDFPLMMLVVFFVCIPVYGFDVFGLRSVAWTFRTRTRGIVSWVVLIALTLYCAVSVLSRM